MTQPDHSPHDLLASAGVLVLCQLAGEAVAMAVSALAGPTIPGPVVGFLILVCYLLAKGGISDSLNAVSAFLLGIMSLLFVPSAVGMIDNWDLIVTWGLPILLSVVISTLLTMAATASTFTLVDRWMNRERP